MTILSMGIEINLSRESSIRVWAALLGVHDKEHLMLSPEFRSKLIEAMIDLPVEAELVTEAGHHIFRADEDHAKMVVEEALRRMK